MDEVSTENTEKHLWALYFCYEKKKGGGRSSIIPRLDFCNEERGFKRYIVQQVLYLLFAIISLIR